MVTYSPHRELVREILERAEKALTGSGYRCKLSPDDVRKPPKGAGDIALQLFRAAKEANAPPQTLASIVAESFSPGGLLTSASAARGYVNYAVDVASYGKLVIDTIERLGPGYGNVPTERPLRIIVEHTSANPIHPLHIGHLRNCLLGDSLARILRARGHNVRTHFYIDDVGLQVAYAAYGYSKVRDMRGRLKPDHFVGLVYSTTYILVELEEAKRRLKEAKEAGLDEEVLRVQRKIDDLVASANELREKDEELFYRLLDAISKDPDPMGRVQEINRAYERGEPWAVKMVRELVEACLDGFKETFKRLGVEFDSWDWESELTVWNTAAEDVVKRLIDAGLVRRKNGALVFAADVVAEDPQVRKQLGIPLSYTVTSLTLTRSDGTTLYPTRDIAYSIWKLRQADKVINVIAVQQRLAQIHVRLALYALGERERARNLVHYAYEIVRLPGVKMSGRRGRYVSADQLLDEAVALVREKIESEGRTMSEEEKTKIATAVGLGAVKYAILSVSPLKVVTFVWERVLDLSQNSGPFVQYAYVRAASILRRAKEESVAPDASKSKLFGEEEKALVLMLGEFPEVVVSAADELRPDYIAGYLNALAQEFNKYYDSVPVLRAPRDLAEARLALVRAVARVLKKGLYLLGIETPEKM